MGHGGADPVDGAAADRAPLAAGADASATAPPFDEVVLSRIEDAGLNASATPHQRWIDGWIVRYAAGKAKRARCINAVAMGLRPVADKLAECADLFRWAGLPLVVRITPFSQPPALDNHLQALGWHAFDETRVMVLDLAAARWPATALPTGWVQTVEGPQDYARTVGELRDSSTLEIQGHAHRLAHSPVPYTGLAWRDAAGRAQSCGQFAREGDVAGLYDVVTAPSARGRGLATALCARLLDGARQDGARLAYLQVDAANTPALHVYRRLGFIDAYRYHYRSPEASAH